jgi:hypothetical protein
LSDKWTEFVNAGGEYWKGLKLAKSFTGTGDMDSYTSSRTASLYFSQKTRCPAEGRINGGAKSAIFALLNGRRTAKGLVLYASRQFWIET